MKIASMFNATGPGAGDLQRLQVEMLRSLSTKLDVIQETLLTLSGQVNELQEMFGALPSKVAEEVAKSQLNGGIEAHLQAVARRL